MYILLKEIPIGKSNYKIFGITFVSIGLIILIISLFTFTSAKKTYNRYLQTEGTVIANQVCGDDQTSAKAIISFSTQAGRTEEFTSSCSYPSIFKEGEKVKVLYSENNPRMAVVAKNAELYGLWLIGGISSFTFLSIGSIILFMAGKQQMVGMGASIIIGVFFFLIGMFVIFLGSDYWNKNSGMTVAGILTIAFGIFVVVWEKIKEIIRRRTDQ